MSTPMRAGQASIWVQPNGANTQPQYLGCHDVGDVDEPLGDLELVYCPDPGRAGKFQVVASYQTEPGPVTTSLTSLVHAVADWLEKVKCPASIFVHKVTCNRRDNFLNYQRSFALLNAVVTSRGLSNLAVRTPGDETESEQTFDISAELLMRIFEMAAAQQDSCGTEDLNDIVFCNEEKCTDDCGPAEDACEFGVAVGASEGASVGQEADLCITTDGGKTWTAAAANPFAAGEDIAAVVCVQVGKDVTRVIVARGTTDAGNPAEIAYSDDTGATWTNVDVGAVNGEYVLEGGGLFALSPWNIWLVTDGGYIYHSTDAGLTWTVQEAGVLAATGWNVVEFLDENIGYVGGPANELAKTEDGGASWTALTAPAAEAGNAITALEVITKERAFIGYDSGNLYYTEDGGATWAERAITAETLIAIDDVDFYNELIGFLVGDVAGPVGVLLRTIDGGYSWESIPMPTNVGIVAVWACGPNTAFGVGPATGGQGFIVKAFETA